MVTEPDWLSRDLGAEDLRLNTGNAGDRVHAQN